MRQYSQLDGRFYCPDALCEKYYSLSPYQYALNNPVMALDANGKFGQAAPIAAGTAYVVGAVSLAVTTHLYLYENDEAYRSEFDKAGRTVEQVAKEAYDSAISDIEGVISAFDELFPEYVSTGDQSPSTTFPADATGTTTSSTYDIDEELKELLSKPMESRHNGRINDTEAAGQSDEWVKEKLKNSKTKQEKRRWEKELKARDRRNTGKQRKLPKRK